MKRLVPLLLIILISGCHEANMHDRKNPGDEYFRTAKAHYIIDGQKYDVPMGYQWFVHIKLNQWPEPKSDYTETTAFSVYALLPDFRMYSEATRAAFDDRRGHGNVIDIMIQSTANRTRPIAELLKQWEASGRLERLPDNPQAPGLSHYLDKKLKDAKESMWDDVYVPAEGKSAEFWIKCSRDQPDNSCDVYETPATPSSPSLKYSFGIEHLARWDNIRKGVTTLVNGFRPQTN